MSEVFPFLKDTLPDRVKVEREVVLPEGLSDQLVVRALESVFGSQDDLNVVAVHWRSESAYVMRSDFLDALSPVMRSAAGLGDSDQMFLPGEGKLSAINLVCPIDGQCFEFYFLDPDGVELCPNHPDTRLEVVAAE